MQYATSERSDVEHSAFAEADGFLLKGSSSSPHVYFSAPWELFLSLDWDSSYWVLSDLQGQQTVFIWT